MLNEAFSPFLELAKGKLVLMCVLNFHCTSSDAADVTTFDCLHDNLGLKQHALELNHKSGHELDVTITKSQILVTYIHTEGFLILDGYFISIDVDIVKLPFSRGEITFRKLTTIDITMLKEDVKSSAISTFSQTFTDDLVRSFFMSF